MKRSRANAPTEVFDDIPPRYRGHLQSLKARVEELEGSKNEQAFIIAQLRTDLHIQGAISAEAEKRHRIAIGTLTIVLGLVVLYLIA